MWWKFDQNSIRLRTRFKRTSIKNRQTTETAEPLFLLTGAVLWPCSTFAILARSSTEIVQNWFHFCTVAYHQVSFQNSFKSARISTKNAIVFWFNVFKMRSKFGFLNSFKFRALKSASLGAPRPLPGRSPGTPRARRARSRSSLSTPWTSRVPQVGPGSDFRSKFDQNSFDFRSKFGQNSIEIGLI